MTICSKNFSNYTFSRSREGIIRRVSALAILDAAYVSESLRYLSVANPDIFGGDGHAFQLNPPLKEAECCAFEQHHNVSLPAEYRHFLTALGNGGAGPFYGVFPLGKMDAPVGGGLQTWSENDGLVGALSLPFMLADEWNDLQGMPSDELRDTDEKEFERQFDQFEERYFNTSLVNGAIPICHKGCALRIWLVVTGGQAGHLWHDGRSDYTGITPLRLADGSLATFSLWYGEWLEEALRQARPGYRKSP